jgi:DNA-binding LacI/PurR family transcriptional regulator
MNNRLRNQDDSLPQAITINDIANELGVSKTTVSRALSGKGRIGAETREKILAYINEHGYRPNLIAKSLAVSRTFNIAVVLPTDTEVNEVPFFQTCLHSITTTVTERDYDVVLSVTTGQNISALKRLIRNHKVDGVILTRLLSDDKAVAFLKESGIPFAVIGTSSDDSIIQIDSNQRAGCRDITEYILHHGSQRNILLAGNPDHQVNKDRYAGFYAACSESGLMPDEGSVFWNVTDTNRTAEILSEVMTQQPDCLVCMDDVICSRVLSWLQKNGWKIPQDIRIVSFYDSAMMEQYHPPITALHVNVQELGACAGNILLDLISGTNVSARNLVGYELRIRDSSRLN